VAQGGASEDVPQAFHQPAGYNLEQGIGGEPLKMPPNMLARGFRQERVLMSHEGYEAKGSDYNHPGEVGIRRYKARQGGV
jgi:hypothetical protein